MRLREAYLSVATTVSTRTASASWRTGWIGFVVRPKVWQSCVLAVLFAAAGTMFETLFARVAFISNGSAVWWPIDGAAVGVLLIARRRHWPWLLAGFAAAIAVSEGTASPHRAILATICDTLQVWLVALALPRFRTLDGWLRQPGVALRFTVWAVFLSSVASGLLGAAYVTGRPGDPYWLTALRWTASDALGSALMTPLVLVLMGRETWLLFRPAALPRTIGLLGLVIAASWCVFHQSVLPISFVLYPLLLLTGTQLGLSGGVIAANTIAFIATTSTLRGEGPFGSWVLGPEAARVLVLQSYLVLTVSMMLPIGVARVRRLTSEARLRRFARDMERLAEVDGLTGVANRRRFDNTLAAEWRRATRQRTPVALLMIDADHFKAFNDNYGHPAGDACLRSIAWAIKSVTGRSGDLVARYGGEEFALLLPGCDAVGARSAADRVCRAVFDLALPHETNEAERVTVSVGAASLLPEDGTDQMTLIDVSDKALYMAKRGGRNRVYLAFEPAQVLA